MLQTLIHGVVFIVAAQFFLLSPVKSRSLNMTNLADQYPLQLQTIFAKVPPKLNFPDDQWNVDNQQDQERMDKINAAYTEAFALAQYAIKDVLMKPLDIQHIPRLYFPPKYLKTHGMIEGVLSLFALEKGKENYCYVFEKINVYKGTNHPTCQLPRVAAFARAGSGGTTDTILTICELFFQDVFSTSLLTKPCNQLCDEHDDTWLSLSSILLHELTHIQEVGIKGKPKTGGIRDVEMTDYKKASADCQLNGAYGWKCCQELNKYDEGVTHANADSYMWMVIDQVVEGRCFNGRNREACIRHNP
ncbi:hypothetical protein CPB83DRAFT_859837 [Crepidotus variabilis]|uniref:Lysine-specific metallo-endopeptidase domain-containing protein n=1 Tax=Crepidotus variabilis TaxID=179855 RepID=A0A9P6JM44_9AGAR|nr:hypothetical protein CPB83DRAFT_859837 [Crepidotus variabilis]